MICHVLTVSSGTLASRLLGFVRDAMVAALIGAGPIVDAFLVAFQLINVVRRLLSEGALNAALVPAYMRARDAGAMVAAAFAGRVLGTVSLAVLVAATLLGIAAPAVIALLAPGFVGQPTLQLAITDARLMLPYLAFAGPVTVMMALLNAQHRFALNAFSPLLFNLALIAVMAVLLLRAVDATRAALIIAATVGVVGLLQLATLALSRRGGALATPLRVAFDAPMRQLLGKAIPGMIASAGPQLLIVAGAIIASRSPSVVSWLYFANRLIDLPLGIAGAALGTVLIPVLTQAMRAEDAAAVGRAQSRGLELAFGLALPATLGLIVLAQPIVHVLFEHGAFTAVDTRATAQALRLLALGLPAQVLVKTLSPAFFAREDAMTPLIATLTGFGVAIMAALMFAASDAAGVATAIAAGAWSSAAVLGARARVSLDADAIRRLPRIIAAALLMGAAMWLQTGLVRPFDPPSHSLAQALMLGMVIAGGLAIYGGLLALLGVLNVAVLARRLRR